MHVLLKGVLTICTVLAVLAAWCTVGALVASAWPLDREARRYTLAVWLWPITAAIIAVRLTVSAAFAIGQGVAQGIKEGLNND